MIQGELRRVHSPKTNCWWGEPKACSPEPAPCRRVQFVLPVYLRPCSNWNPNNICRAATTLFFAFGQKALKRRRVVLSLTQKGVALFKRVLVVALEREKVLLTGFSEAERKMIIRLLHRIHQNIPDVIILARQLLNKPGNK